MRLVILVAGLVASTTSFALTFRPALATRNTLRKDEVVFLQGSAANAVFYIQRGKIKILVSSKQGKEAVVGVMNPGEFFGEGCMIGQPLRLATAQAMIESQIVRVCSIRPPW